MRTLVTILIGTSFLSIAGLALAAAPAPTPSGPGQFQFQPIVSIPLSTGGIVDGTTALKDYFNAAFKIAITVAVSLAVIMIMIDGFKYMTSEAVGNKKDALAGIRSALFGLVLLLASYLILFIINPCILTLSVFDQSSVAGCPSAQQNSSLNSTSNTQVQGTQTGKQSPPLTNQTPDSQGKPGSGNFCFTDQRAGTICAATMEACQNLHDTTYRATATSECVDKTTPNQDTYLDQSGNRYSSNPESVYYTGYGDSQFAFYIDFDLFLSGKKLKSPIRIARKATPTPQGITPDQIKTFYNLPKTGGKGTIAIIDPYNQPSLESDLNTFSSAFGLPSCTQANGCLEVHSFSNTTATDVGGWNGEIALDVEWAHAIAPSAKILLVSAVDPTFQSLMQAVDYATSRPDVVSVSMSFGGGESSGITALDSHFTSSHEVLFFASTGDKGHEVNYPAVSPNVIAVGGTVFDPNGAPETGWGYKDDKGAQQGSGGGVSQFETEPSYQTAYGIPQSGGKRGVPDVSYASCGAPGSKLGYATVLNGEWSPTCGTSASAPQWAALSVLGSGLSANKLYTDAKSPQAADYFRDITAGTNGSCGFACTAQEGYDYVTGLGSPKTARF